jgi:hypothetical protein
MAQAYPCAKTLGRAPAHIRYAGKSCHGQTLYPIWPIHNGEKTFYNLAQVKLSQFVLPHTLLLYKLERFFPD